MYNCKNKWEADIKGYTVIQLQSSEFPDQAAVSANTRQVMISYGTRPGLFQFLLILSFLTWKIFQSHESSSS